MEAETPSRDALKDELLAIIAKEGKVELAGLTRDMVLVDAGIASIDVMSILFAVEDRFGVDIQTAGMEQLETLGELVDWLAESLPEQP